MKCIDCKSDNTHVIDSRMIQSGRVRRRRLCLGCGTRFSTYEIRADEIDVDKTCKCGIRDKLVSLVAATQ